MAAILDTGLTAASGGAAAAAANVGSADRHLSSWRLEASTRAAASRDLRHRKMDKS